MTRSFRRQGTTGAERKGIRGDIRLVLSDQRAPIEKEPTAQKSAALISSVRYFGDREGRTPAEAMTASSAALYEYLMARWRPTLKDKETCEVSYADAKAYLGIEKTSRLRSYMSALSSTWVSYDFLDKEEGFRRRGSRVQLLNCEELVHEVSGEHFIGISMFPGVRKAILESDRWANIELGAYPRFSSKYTALLYPTLALMSGREHRPALRWTPEQLAQILGWQPDVFKFSNFESRVLKPVLDDIRNHVRRFQVRCAYVRAATRGRPVVEIVITVGKACKMPEEFQKAEMHSRDRTAVLQIAKSAAIDLNTQMPGEDYLRRAATRLRVSVTEVASMWTEAFADPLTMKMLEEDGLLVAFEGWVIRQEDAAAAANERTDELVDFASVETIVVDLAEGYDISHIAPLVRSHVWTGSDRKALRVRWEKDGRQQREFDVWPTEGDVGLFWRANSDLIADLDFEAAA
jgi:hypothetical protein